MKRIQILLLIFVVFNIVSCNSEQRKIQQKNSELLNHLRSGSYILVEKNEVQVSGNFGNDSLIVEYYSVPPKEYYEAFESVNYLQKHFSRTEKINEGFEEKAYRRNDSLVLIGSDSKNFILTENLRDNYFYEAGIGNFHIIRAMEFEDVNTYFISSKNGDVIYTKWGASVATYPDEKIVFYSDNFLNSLRDSTETSFYQIENDSLKNLVTIKSDWFAGFAFLKKPDELYYLHSFYENNSSWKSSYAKMKIRKK